MAGKLITIEGIDGSGKTTILESIDEEMIDADIEKTREPTRWSDPGELLMKSLKSGETIDMTELFLFMADHSEHLEKTIKPRLEDDKIIVCDRYVDSRCAYQGATIGTIGQQRAIEYVYELHEDWSIFPDYTIFIDISIDEALERLDTDHRHETRERLENVYENYKWLIEKDSERFVVVDGEATVEEVTQEVAEIINGLTTQKYG